MNSKDVEADQLRKQIQFLESLITSANVKKSKDSDPNFKSAAGTNLYKASTDLNLQSKYFKQQLSTGTGTKVGNTKYTWNKSHHSGKEKEYISTGRNTQKSNAPYSRHVTDISSNTCTYRKNHSSHSGKAVFSYVNADNRNVVNLPESHARLDENKFQQGKSKSFFSWQSNLQWKSNPHWERSTDILDAKQKDTFVKSNTASHTKYVATSSREINPNVLKPGTKRESEKHGQVNVSAGTTHPLKTLSSPPVDKTKSQKLPESGAKNVLHPHHTSTTSNKHSSLQSDLLVAQTSLEEWKRRLVEKKKTLHSQPGAFQGGISKLLKVPIQSKQRIPKFHSSYPSHYSYSNLQNEHYGKHYSHHNEFPKDRWKTKQHGYWKSYYSAVGIGRSFKRGQSGHYGNVHSRNYKYSYQQRGSKVFNNHSYYPNNFGDKRYTFRRNQIISKVYRRRIERMKSLKDKVPFNPKMKIDRRNGGDKTKGLRFVVINGMLYKTSTKSLVRASGNQCVQSSSQHRKSTDLTGTRSKIKFLNTTAMKTVIVRGVRFKVDRDGKSLKKMETFQDGGTSTSTQTQGTSSISRVDIGGVTYRQTKPGTLEKVTTRKTRVMARRVVNRSVAQVASRYKKDNTKLTKQEQFCMFYNRFGKCNKQEKCSFKHDPDRIAVCTRFLRGTCKVKSCPFSHKVSVEKLPVCSYFLKGVCNKTDCPYPHVNVNRNAEICKDFVNGYCSLGNKCKKKHTLLCPSYMKTKTCPDGKKCQLQHRVQKRRKSSSSDKSSKHTRVGNHLSGVPEVSDTHLPFKERRLPAYISLNIKDKDDATTKTSEAGTSSSVAEASSSMKIRPQL